MSKFVFSSFVIGVGTSAFVSLAVNERIFERKLMFQPKENTDELVQAYYEQVSPLGFAHLLKPMLNPWCTSIETARKNSREATAATKVATAGIAREDQLWGHSGRRWCIKQALLEVSSRTYRWNQQQVQVNESSWVVSPQKWVDWLYVNSDCRSFTRVKRKKEVSTSEISLIFSRCHCGKMFLHPTSNPFVLKLIPCTTATALFALDVKTLDVKTPIQALLFPSTHIYTNEGCVLQPTITVVA